MRWLSGLQKPHARLDTAVVEQPGRRRRHDGHFRVPSREPARNEPHLVGAAALLGGLARLADGRFRLQRPRPLAADELGYAGRRSRSFVGGERLRVGQLDLVCIDVLDALIVGAALDGLLEIVFDQFFQVLEQLVLIVDRQRQQPVQEGRHRRRVVLQFLTAVGGERQAGGAVEPFFGPSVDAVPHQVVVELAERLVRVDGLEVVARVEERAVVVAHGGLRVALAARDRPQRVQPLGDGGDEPALGLHVGGHGPEDGGRHLVRAVRAAQSLDGLVGPPSGFQQVVDAAAAVSAAGVGVVAAPRPAGSREDEDQLLAGHELLGLPQVGGVRPRPHGQALSLVVGDAHDAAGTARDLGDALGAEVMDQLVEGGRDGRHRAEPFDQLVAHADGDLRLHRVAVRVEYLAAADVPLLVGVLLVQVERERAAKIVQDVLARGHVDGQVVPLADRDLLDPPLHQRLAGRDDLDHSGAPLGDVAARPSG